MEKASPCDACCFFWTLGLPFDKNNRNVDGRLDWITGIGIDYADLTLITNGITPYEWC